jgi:hypothetical protein
MGFMDKRLYNYRDKNTPSIGGINSLARSPGYKSNQNLGSQIISRRWRPSPTPTSDSVVTIVGGSFRLDGLGSFTTDPSVWGTSRFIETSVTSNSEEYEYESQAVQTIGGVDYIFVIATKENPAISAQYWSDLDDENILDINGDPIEVINI